MDRRSLSRTRLLLGVDRRIAALVGLLSLLTFTTMAGNLPPNVHPGEMTRQAQYRTLFALAVVGSVSLGRSRSGIALGWLWFVAVRLPGTLSRCSTFPADATGIVHTACYGLSREADVLSIVLAALLLSVVHGVLLGSVFHGVGYVLRRPASA